MELKRFNSQVEKDRKYIEDWMISWDYQEERKQHVKYPNEHPQSFDTYNGMADLIRWMNWIGKYTYPHQFPKSIIYPLIVDSIDYDTSILEEHVNVSGIEPPPVFTMGKYNAQDYLFQTMYPKPFKIERMLDFGAGYGRQINLWSQHHRDDLTYVGMDSVPQSYCLQNLYYRYADMPMYEYMEKKRLKIKKKGIYHIPTWRTDLLPSKYFDMVSAVQVMQEINEELVKHMLDEFKRVLKVGGELYIRDHGMAFKYSAHKLDIEEMLWDMDFTLEYEPDYVDYEEIHGIPRIWRKN